MSMTSPDRIEMSQAQRQRLRHLIRAGTTAQQLARRARIVLLAAAGWTNTTIARHVGVCVDTVRKWRHRWWVQPLANGVHTHADVAGDRRVGPHALAVAGAPEAVTPEHPRRRWQRQWPRREADPSDATWSE